MTRNTTCGYGTRCVSVALLAFVASGILGVSGADTAASEAKTSATTAPTAVTISIDTLSNRHAISPYVYGFAYPNSPADITNTGATEVRWGGDATSTYNWQLRTDNAAADWYFEDFSASGFNNGSDGSSIQFIADVKKAGANPLMAMVMLPWVAQSPETSTTQGGTDNYHWSYSVGSFGPQMQRGSVQHRCRRRAPDELLDTGDDERRDLSVLPFA